MCNAETLDECALSLRNTHCRLKKGAMDGRFLLSFVDHCRTLVRDAVASCSSNRAGPQVAEKAPDVAGLRDLSQLRCRCQRVRSFPDALQSHLVQGVGLPATKLAAVAEECAVYVICGVWE